MSMNVLSSESGVVLPAYSFYIPSHSFGGLHHAQPRGYIRAYDPINKASRFVTAPLGLDTSAHAVGLSGSSLTDGKFVLSHRPSTRPYDPLYDLVTYGNLYHLGWGHFVNTLSGGQIKRPSTNHENNTRHASYEGTLSSQILNLELESASTTILGAVIQPQQIVGGVATQLSCSNREPWRFTRYGPSTQSYDFVSFMSEFENFESAWYPGVFGWDRHKSRVSGLNFSISPGQVSISYHVNVEELSNTWTMEWDTEITMVFPDRLCDHWSNEPIVGAVLTGSIPCSVKYTYSSYMELYQGRYYGPYDFEWNSSQGVNLVFLKEQVNAPTISEDWRTVDRISSYLDKSLALHKFKKECDLSWGDILPASALSTTAALKNMSGAINVNNVETLNELPGITSAVPDLRQALKIASQITRKDVSLMTVHDVIDLATSTQLKSSFIWRPYGELITKHLPRISAVLREMALTRTLTRGYGTFSTELTKVLGREKVFLTVKTKVVADISLPSLMSLLLTLDDVGIIPKFSRVWELAPSSFILDWIYSVGNVLKELEAVSTCWPFPILYVHSYELFSPFSKAELESMETSSPDPSTTGLKYYCRDVSLYPSVPRPSRFGFDIPDDLPPLEVLGSLLYQKLF